MTTPSLVRRPEHIDPIAWARASWYARLRYVNTLTRAERAEYDPDPPRRSIADRYAADVEVLIATGHDTLEAVAEALGRTPDTVYDRLMSASRPDLVAILRGES